MVNTLQRELSDVRGYQHRLEAERDEAQAAAAATTAALTKQKAVAVAAAEVAAQELETARQETASALVRIVVSYRVLTQLITHTSHVPRVRTLAGRSPAAKGDGRRCSVSGAPAGHGTRAADYESASGGERGERGVSVRDQTSGTHVAHCPPLSRCPVSSSITHTVLRSLALQGTRRDFAIRAEPEGERKRARCGYCPGRERKEGGGDIAGRVNCVQ